jgi:hypothetical protein
MIWSDLVREAHETACAKGWHDYSAPTLDRAGALIALIHDEVSEAWLVEHEARAPIDWTAAKPSHFVFELADIVIRLGDLFGLFRWPCDNFDLASVIAPDEPLGAMAVVFEVNDSILRRLRDGDDPYACGPALIVGQVLAWWLTMHRRADNPAGWAGKLRRTFVRAIAHKMKYNTTRAHRHGGKHL